MQSGQRLSIIGLVFIGLGGLFAGFVLQQIRSGQGFQTFVPPITLPATLLVIAAMLTYFALKMRRDLDGKTGKRVDPFFAVRLLAASRAAQIAGALFMGFSFGLIVMLFWRPVEVRTGIWLPMLLAFITAALVLAAGVFAESVCKLPPEDTEESEQPEGILEG